MRRAVVCPLLLTGLLVLTPAPTADAGGPGVALDVEVLVDDLDLPWGLDFLPNGTMVFTEREGGWFTLAPPYTATPTPVAYNDSDLYVSGETGLLDLLIDPNFAQNRRMFTCQGHRQGSQTRRIQVISWRLRPGNAQAVRIQDPLVDAATLYGQPGRHGGCRLRFDGDGHLWIATGDGANSNNPQNLNTLGGKVLRVNPNNGNGVAGNPWFASGNPNRRRIWNFGHRNLQGLALRPGTTAAFWTVEHGPGIDDEVNRALKGKNFGWAPGPGYDEGVPMTDLSQFPNAAVARWSSGNPTIATSGAVFLEGAEWDEWEGSLAVACLAGEQLKIFTFDDAGPPTATATPSELDNVPAYGRLRTPVMGPGGDLYLTTSNGGNNDAILRITAET